MDEETLNEIKASIELCAPIEAAVEGIDDTTAITTLLVLAYQRWAASPRLRPWAWWCDAARLEYEDAARDANGGAVREVKP
jgi:hypothetical protein